MITRASQRALPRHQRKPYRSKRVAWIAGGVLTAVVLGAACWVSTRALIVKSELEAAETLVDELTLEAKSFDLKALEATTAKLRKHSGTAADTAQDPVWRVTEVIPYIGDNLRGVRVAATSIDGIVTDVAAPAVDLIVNFDAGARDPVTGGFDLTPLNKARDLLASAEVVLADVDRDLASVNTARTVAPVTAAVDKLKGMLTKVGDPLKSAAPLIDAAGALLGQNGPRNYLLAFQNNAEVTALGGSAASYTQLTVDGGKVGIAAQGAGSNDLQTGVKLDIAVDQSALDLYSDYLISYPNTSTSRPDFPTAAQIMSAYWLRDKGQAVDGVLSVDPLALALILKATGPITLSSGDVLSSDNAVSLLLNEIYFRIDSYKEPEKVDAFFQEAAASILDKVTSGQFDIKTMFSSVEQGINQGSIMMWSSKPEEQALLEGTRAEGVLPKTNDDGTVIGVYYRDTSASKIDYYLQTATATSSDVCTNPNNPTFTTSVTLHSNLTQEQADALPDYVKSYNFKSKMFSTQVFVYGPAGASVSQARVDAQGVKTLVGASAVDLGRPVAVFTAYLAPGETSTVTATFTGAPGAYGPMEIRGTPMINETARTLDAPGCA